MTISLIGSIFGVCVTKKRMRLSHTICQNCQILNWVRPSDDDYKVVALSEKDQSSFFFVSGVERRQKLELSLGDSFCLALVTSVR